MFLRIFITSALFMLLGLVLVIARPSQNEVPWYGDTTACGENYVLKYSVSDHVFKCRPGVAAGSVVMMISGACGDGYSEVAELNGRTLIGTVSANNDVGTTGGLDTVIPAGTNTGCATVRVTKNPAGDAIVCSPQFTPEFTGAELDNRSSYLKVIFCRKN